MILSRNWLEQYLNLDGINNHKITQALNSLGFEVEKEIDWKQMNDPLIIGHVQSSQPIPGTHLSLNYVDIGKTKPLQIVCGAPNVAAEQLVIVAQVGQKIANGLLLTNRQIKNYESQGMICALNEIGIENQYLTEKENDSIYEINPVKRDLIAQEIGAIGLHDYLWDVDLTLNRSDALAATQLLKELANYFHRKIQWRSVVIPSTKKLVSPVIKIDKNLNKDVNTLAVETIQLKPKNQILKVADDLLLKKLKIKTTTNFYEDLINLNSWETGQPLVIFDEEKITQTLTLTTTSWNDKKVIALMDGERIVTIIGLPTELNYVPTATTKKMGVVALSFQPPIMRQQQKALNQSSTALQRFMKPLNPNLYDLSFKNWSYLLKNYHLLDAVSPITILHETHHPKVNFQLSLQKINDFLGMNLDFMTIKNLFTNLDVQVKQLKNQDLIFEMDPNRVDLFGTNDIIEEIARLYGYDKIPMVPLQMETQIPPSNLEFDLIQQTQNYLLGRGLMNVKTYSLVNTDEAKNWNIFNLKQPLGLMSPLSQAHEIYRSSLAASLIQVAQYNALNGQKKYQIWEIADIYSGVNQRQKHLGILVSGHLWDEPLIANRVENNFFYLKGLLTTIAKLYQIPTTQIVFKPMDSKLKTIHPFVQAKIEINNKIIGFIFRLNPQFEQQKKLHPTFVAELNLNALWQLGNHKITLEPLSKFQSSSRDISFVLPESLNFATTIQNLSVDLPNLVNWHLVDVYQDDNLKEHQKQALTVTFIFNSLHKQLTETDINEAWTELLARAKKIGAQIR